MPGMFIGGFGQSSTVGQVAATTLGTTLTGGSPANNLGNYAQLTASTPHDAHAIIVSGRVGATNGQSNLVDIAIGGAGSEQVVVSGLLIQGPRAVWQYYLPIYVPGGVRLSARSRSSGNGGTSYLSVTLLRNQLGGQPALGRASCYGGNTGDSGATSVDPGGSANTKGAYSQITASTTRAHKGFIIAAGNDKNTATTGGDWFYDIAIGGAGSERIIYADWWTNQANTGAAAQNAPIQSHLIMLPIPESTRIAVRAQSTVIDATDRLTDVMIIGVD